MFVVFVRVGAAVVLELPQFLQGAGAGAVEALLVALEGEVGGLRDAHGGGEEAGRGFGEGVRFRLIALLVAVVECGMSVLLRRVLLIVLLLVAGADAAGQVVERVAGEERGFGVGDSPQAPGEVGDAVGEVVFH